MALAEIVGRPGDPLVFRLHHRAAFTADQELPGVRVIGMVAGDEGSRAVQSNT